MILVVGLDLYSLKDIELALELPDDLLEDDLWVFCYVDALAFDGDHRQAPLLEEHPGVLYQYVVLVRLGYILVDCIYLTHFLIFLGLAGISVDRDYVVPPVGKGHQRLHALRGDLDGEYL